MTLKTFLVLCTILGIKGAEADGCPIEIDPPAVVVKYGDPVSVNCTVSTDHQGMGWVAQQNLVPNQLGVQFLLWSVANLTVWDINPMCFANFNERPQCDKVVSVTVYKTPDSVSVRVMNHTGPLVEGNQYELVCEVQNVAPVQNLTVKWYKGTEVVNVTLDSGESKTPVNVSTTLLITPNRTDDGAQYTCAAELELGSNSTSSPPTAKSEALNVTVHYPPVISKGDDDLTVMQGHMVSLMCSFQGNPPPHVQWILPSGNVHNTTVKNNSIAIEVSADSPGVYTCTASNYLGNATRTVSVTVGSPSPPSLTTAALSNAEADGCPIEIDPPAVVVKYGDPVSVNCTVSTDHQGMGWVAQQNPVPNQLGVQFLLWSVANLTVWDINPTCFANFNESSQCDKVVSVTVYKTPDSISIRSENHTGPLVEGKQYKLGCEVENVAPVQNLTVKWYKGIEVVKKTLYSEESNTPMSVSSTILITPNRTDNGAQYRCVAELDLGPEGPQPFPATESFSITVDYPPVISKGEDNLIVMQGQIASLICRSQGNPPPHVQWILPSGIVHNSTVKNNSIATEVSAYSPGVYTCTASNYLGNAIRTVSVTVVRKGHTISVVTAVVVILVLLLLFISFVMKKRGQRGNYSVSARHSGCTSNPNNIPMQCFIGNGTHQSLQESQTDGENQDLM